ncbi:unnamed protein product, partial [Polarella glacialis]
VTLENRNGLIEDICKLLRATLFPEDVAQEIQSKASLAQKYVTELPARLERLSPDRLRFRGDHGAYEISQQPGLLQPFCCSCPFWFQRQTCSHTLALLMSTATMTVNSQQY